MKSVKNRLGTYVCAALVAAFASQALYPIGATADPFKLGAEQSMTIQGPQGAYEYPSPQAIAPQRPMTASVRSNTFQGGTQRTAPPPQPPRQPMQMNIQRTVVLPQGYLGVWHVQGNRSAVDALPEFMQTAQTAFATGTDNMWQISGNPGSYSMGNGQMNTQLYVDRVGPDGTAFIRYQHQIGKTMAQEAIVLTLAPGGMAFNGLERISIVKDGGPPRAKVTYQLMGQRQR